MAKLIITGVPHPPENEQWCAACLALAKGSIFADPDTQKRAKDGLADDSREVFAIAADPKDMVRRLELAISWGPHALLAGAVVPLCILHFPAIDGTAPPPGPPNQGKQLWRGGLS